MMSYNLRRAAQPPRSHRLPAALLLLTGLFVGTVPISNSQVCADDSVSASVPQTEDFTDEQMMFVREKIQPLLQARCAECHGSSAEGKGGLRLTSREAMLIGGDSGPVLVPSQPEQSLLISAVRYEDFEMPPRNRLPGGEVQLLEQWIRMGAPWPAESSVLPEPAPRAEFPLAERKAAHWAWHPLKASDVPSSADSAWAIDDVDQFVLQRLAQNGLTPAPDADRRALIRRLYFDLIGLPPTIEQQDRFFNDPADLHTAMSNVVDELLQSPHFGERWARHWLDLVRYAETLGHEFDYPLPYAWRYRDYVIRAVNSDVPYDQFVMEHIAGDLLPEPRLNPEQRFNESIIATGFWFLHEDKHAPVDVRGEEAARVDNQIDVFSKTFLGLTVACARCHDHKFDAITTQDYYALAGFLRSSRRRVEMLDPDQGIRQSSEQLQSLRENAERMLRQDLRLWTTDRLTDLLQESLGLARTVPAVDDTDPQRAVVHQLNTLLMQETSLRADHPLSLPAELIRSVSAGSDLSGDAIASIIDRWCRRIASAAVSESSTRSILFADFRDGLPPGWRTYGAAFRHSRAGDDRHPSDQVVSELSTRANTDMERPLRGLAQGSMSWTSDGPAVVPLDHISSAELAPALTGVLQSPSFELTHPEILVEVAGRASRLRLVIDGYVMNEFSELLFNGARQSIDTDGEFRWVRLAGDIQRYLGHRCHLEFLDEGDGWFAVREVRMVTEPGGSGPDSERVSAVNQQLSAELSRQPVRELQQVARQWSGSMLRDTRWPALAVELGALPCVSSPEFVAVKQSWREKSQHIPAGIPVLVICDGTPEDERVFIRGNHKNPGPVVPRRFLQVYAGEQPCDFQNGSGRLELAKQLLAEESPLPARVTVNRVWQHLFGIGLVASADNLGVLGEAPSHPELLDYLADQFRTDGWSVKRLIRRLVLTRTYRLSAHRDQAAESVDPANRLLHRANIRRLEAEVIRDAMLSVSGRLLPELYGRSIPVYLTPFMQGRGRPGKSGPLDGAGRRSIYQSVNRNFLSPFMLAFDTPVPATTVGRRSVSNVPAQALILLNNEFVSQQAAVWADRLAAGNHPDVRTLIDTAFREAFCRHATAEELAALDHYLQSTARERAIDSVKIATSPELISEICHVLLNQKEFLFLD